MTTNYTTFNNDRCTAIIAHQLDPKHTAMLPINENQPIPTDESTKAGENQLIVELSLTTPQASTKVPAKTTSDTLNTNLLGSLKL